MHAPHTSNSSCFGDIMVLVDDDDKAAAILKCFSYSFSLKDVKVVYFHTNGTIIFITVQNSHYRLELEQHQLNKTHGNCR